MFLELVPAVFELSWRSAIKIVNSTVFQTGFQKLKFTILDNRNSKTHTHSHVFIKYMSNQNQIFVIRVEDRTCGLKCLC